MPNATLPIPQYISYTANILPLIGTDKILVSDTDSTGIPTNEANSLIASGESIALEDLSPYFITVPALITTDGGTWDTLPPQTYTIIYYMFVYQSSLQLIRAFIQRNTNKSNTTLHGFVDNYELEYKKILTRLFEKLPNGSYMYQLIGLQTLNTGIPRKPKQNAISGKIGCANQYIANRLTNPQKNFGFTYPYGWW